MKFSCEKYLLQSACAIASRAAASKSPIPALEGLQISAEDRLFVKGYDLKKGIVTGIEADIAQRGVVVVGARLFGEMIRRLPDGIVTVSSDEKDNISVKCGKSQFNILGISAEDYPELPQFDAVNSIRLAKKESSLLEYFLLNREKELSVDEIFKRVWADEPDMNREVVWVYVSYLRNKLVSVSADVTITGEKTGPYRLSAKS